MINKSPVKSRILEFIDYKGITKYEFYKLTGISRGVLDKENSMTETNIAKFIAIFNEINPSWLLTAQGPMLTPQSTENSLGVKALASSNSVGHLTLVPPQLLSELFSGKISKEELVGEKYHVPLFVEADFLFSLRDMSMFPKYNNGDIIACQQIHSLDAIQWNKIYLLDTTYGILFKRIQESQNKDNFTLISDYELFQPFEINKNDIKAIALVKGGIRIE